MNYLTVNEIAEELRVNRSWVESRIRSGRLPAENLGTSTKACYRVPEVAFEEFRRSLRVRPAPKRSRRRKPAFKEYF